MSTLNAVLADILRRTSVLGITCIRSRRTKCPSFLYDIRAPPPSGCAQYGMYLLTATVGILTMPSFSTDTSTPSP